MTHTPKDCGCIGEICFWHKELDKNIGILQDNYAALKNSHAELLTIARQRVRWCCDTRSVKCGDCLDVLGAISAAESLEVKP